MHKNRWKLQDAKNHFSEVVENAITEGPQEVTRRGKDAVVIISYNVYQELIKPKEDIVDFFQRSPLKGVHLEIERRKDKPRKVEL